MSLFGSEIIDRLPDTSGLKNTDSQAYKLIDNSLGEWLDNYANTSYFEQFFINEADGGYLDLHGLTCSVYRKINENDDDYRDRIIQETLEHLTAHYLKSVYGLTVYTYDSEFTINTLESDNPFLANKGAMVVASSETKEVLEKKFVIGDDVEWLIL